MVERIVIVVSTHKNDFGVLKHGLKFADSCRLLVSGEGVLLAADAWNFAVCPADQLSVLMRTIPPGATVSVACHSHERHLEHHLQGVCDVARLRYFSHYNGVPPLPWLAVLVHAATGKAVGGMCPSQALQQLRDWVEDVDGEINKWAYELLEPLQNYAWKMEGGSELNLASVQDNARKKGLLLSKRLEKWPSRIANPNVIRAAHTKAWEYPLAYAGRSRGNRALLPDFLRAVSEYCHLVLGDDDGHVTGGLKNHPSASP